MENQEKYELTENAPQGHIKVTPAVPELPFQVNEAINTLRGNIQLSGFNIKVVGITSALKHEGKSSLSFRLAQSFSALEKKALYLDCDIRNSQTLLRYKLHSPGPGLSEFLCGKADLDSIIYTTDDPYLDIIFTGGLAPNPSELFSGELFKAMLQYLKESYDYVIVDTPPVNAVIDGVLISNLCDGVVLVVESGVTERAVAKHAKQQLDYAGIKLLGVVLNKVGTRKSGYGYGYGQKYGYGYGQKYGYGYGEDYGYGEEERKTDPDHRKKRLKKK